MEIEFSAQGATITDRFRTYAEDKLQKVLQLLPKAMSVSVRLSRHANPHLQAGGGRVEITVRVPGGVIRAEADGPDKYIAFDAAFHRVVERARRLHEKQTDVRGARRRTPLREVAAGDFAGLDIAPASADVLERAAASADEEQAGGEQDAEWSPVVIREKRFEARPMTVEEAVDQMELVGHPFYLFIDRASGESAVVYRRKGWSYGVLSLEATTAE